MKESIGDVGPVGDPLDPRIGAADAIGIDAGSSLVKISLLDQDGGVHFATWLSPAHEHVLPMLERLAPGKIGLTGSGATEIAEVLGASPGSVPAPILEFDAWGSGANHLLRLTNQVQETPYLLVSIGTGTSLMHVVGDRVERIGGTSLGGGTALGLGLALTDCRSHDDLIEMASRGQRGNVDLLISDIYNADEVPLAGEATASSFGKIARSLSDSNERVTPAKQDFAAAAMGLVAENITLLCTAHAKAAGVQKIVYGGSTIARNPALLDAISLITKVFGFEPILLPRSGHAGAVGAMLLAS